MRNGQATIERVLFTRGRMQAELARLLSPDAVPAGSDPAGACVASRADLMVTSRLGHFDLTSVAVPNDFDGATVAHVVAAVGTGPHAVLAARVAHRIGTTLGVPVEFMTAAPQGRREQAGRELELLASAHPGAGWRVAEDDDIVELLSSVPDHSLLVAGASGGNWFQRQLLGPGARLRARAAAGSVVVRSAPRRVFHRAERPRLWIAPQLHLRDAARLVDDPVVAVAEEGFLVGVARRAAFFRKDARIVGDIMEPPPSLTLTDPLSSVEALADFFEGAPIPIVDDSGRLVASVA